MSIINKAKLILENKELVQFFQEVGAELIETVEDMVSHYNSFSGCTGANLSMSEGDYMRATGNAQECEWACGEIEDALDELRILFIRYSVHHFGRNNRPSVQW